jgi:hypothetical protein
LGARQRTLAGEVARACVVPGWRPGWFLAVSSTVMRAARGSMLRTGQAAPVTGAVW